MFLNNCKTSSRESSSTPWIEFGRVSGSTAQPYVRMFLKSFILSFWKASYVFEKVTYVFEKLRMFLKSFIHIFLKSFILEKLHTKKFFNTVKWAGPCLGEQDHPFIWSLLKVCITSRRNDSLTPQEKLGRDKECWEARPSHKLECLYLAAKHQDERVFQLRERNWTVFGRARPSHKIE